jgi:hypothetical protein
MIHQSVQSKFFELRLYGALRSSAASVANSTQYGATANRNDY